MTLLDLMKLAESEDDLEVDHDDAGNDDSLQDKSRLEPIPDPPKLQGTRLSKRGVSGCNIWKPWSQRLLSR